MSRAGQFACVHCGQPCGVTGHLRRVAPLYNAGCPSVGPVGITAGGEVRLAFMCPPGHTCLTASPKALRFGRSFMTEPVEKRKWRDQRPTPNQLGFLEALGYKGPVPVTKGQAHDLITRVLKGEDVETGGGAGRRGRGILLRDDE